MKSNDILLDEITRSFAPTDEMCVLKYMKSRHVFHDIERYSAAHFSFEERMEIYRIFKMIESCLRLYRSGKINQANLAFSRLSITEQQFNKDIQPGMLAIYYGMVAYKEYVCKDFDAADKAIQHSVLFALRQSVILPRFILTAGDQWFNRIKIFSSYPNIYEELFLKESLALIHFSYKGHIKGKKLNNILEQNDMGEVERIIIFNVDRLIRTSEWLLQKGKISFHFYKSFFQGLYANVKRDDAGFRFDISLIIQLLSNYYEKSTDAFLEEVIEKISLINTMPSIIKKVIANAIIAVIADVENQHPYLKRFEPYVNELKQHFGIKSCVMIKAA
ncbi:hypothetical protein MRBLMN1_002166 [Chitinophaga ginsengisegetis]|uniref:hypothetical protein n=1 Tax=Chitinophaga ginsengisegetis TaxID=393003 RepID=UPI003427997E